MEKPTLNAVRPPEPMLYIQIGWNPAKDQFSLQCSPASMVMLKGMLAFAASILDEQRAKSASSGIIAAPPGLKVA